MPKYKFKNCVAVWYGWGVGKVCRKCGGKLEPFLKNNATKR